MPGTAARTLACAADLFARVRKLRYEGIAIASRIPRMMITTRSSISVKPRSSLRTRCHSLLDILVLLRLDGTCGWQYVDRPALARAMTPERVTKRRRARSPAPFENNSG